jgi:putative ABC transport system permease protein
MRNLVLELRHAWRLARRQPGFSAFAVATLAIGIGAATAVFSLVQAVLLRDFPFAAPDRLAWMYNARTERDRAPFSIPDLQDYRRDNTTLAGLAVFTNWTANLTGSGEAERLEGTRISGDFLPLLGARPLLGRTLDPRDEAGNDRVAMLTHGLWTRRFGADPSIVGTSVVLNGAAWQVVGVMPSGFVFPFRDAEVAVPLPLRDDPRRQDRGANFLRVVARLKPGVTFDQAKTDLTAIAHRLQRLYPEDDARKTGVNLYPLHAEIVSDYRLILWTLFAAVGLLLAIGCGNLANLLLLRAVGRRAELGLRVALGASSRRLVVQLTAEAMILSAMGGGLGLALAAAAIAAWRAFGPPNFPRMASVGINAGVVVAAAAICVAVVIMCGMVPGWLAARDLAGALGSPTRTLTAGARAGRIRRAFVIVQVGGAAVLLVCMVLVARGFARLERVDPGFTPAHALSLQLSLPPARYPGPDAINALYDALRLRLDAIGGIRAVGVVSLLPLSGLLSTQDIAFPDRPAPPPDEVPQAHFRIASDGYFAAAGIGVIDGREFTHADATHARPVAIVSRTLAERHWPGQRVPGKHLRIAQGPQSPLLEIVGVVKDVKQFGVDGVPTADLYVPLAQMPRSQTPVVASRMYWVVRTEGDPARSVQQIRRAVRAVDHDVATSSVRTLDDVLSLSLGSRQTNVRLLEVFGEVALLLAAIGVYAMAAFSAAARRRELAIRSAFGASRGDLIRLVVLGEMRPVLVGVALGLAAARVVAHSLGGVLFSISPSDGPTYVSVAAALVTLTLAATWVPASRAGRADPAELLRA